jgi:hypothetical protein
MKRKNKKGWIEVIEVFISILLMSTLLLTIVEKNSTLNKRDFSDIIYYKQLSILREIETNQTFRDEILNIGDSNLPVNWENIPENVKNKIIQRTPSGLNCVAQICKDFCELFEEVNQKDIYSQSIKIFSIDTSRDLYLFCWQK